MSEQTCGFGGWDTKTCKGGTIKDIKRLLLMKDVFIVLITKRHTINICSSLYVSAVKKINKHKATKKIRLVVGIHTSSKHY